MDPCTSVHFAVHSVEKTLRCLAGDRGMVHVACRRDGDERMRSPDVCHAARISKRLSAVAGKRQ
eukprot:SAG31_NODE_11101_length_1066_cov_1.207859_3_plen_63_part_01